MSNFVKGFAKIKEDKVCLFTELHVLASSSTSMMSCVSQDLFSRNPFCNSKRMFWSVKCVWRSQKPQHAQAPYRGDMSGKLVDNLLGQFYPFFEDRGYVCLFPDGWEFTCVKGFLYTLVAGWWQVLYEGPAELWT